MIRLSLNRFCCSQLHKMVEIIWSSLLKLHKLINVTKIIFADPSLHSRRVLFTCNENYLYVIKFTHRTGFGYHISTYCISFCFDVNKFDFNHLKVPTTKNTLLFLSVDLCVGVWEWGGVNRVCDDLWKRGERLTQNVQSNIENINMNNNFLKCLKKRKLVILKLIRVAIEPEKSGKSGILRKRLEIFAVIYFVTFDNYLSTFLFFLDW